MTDLRAAVRAGVALLADAGVPSPQVDAVHLVAHVLGCEPGEVQRRMVLGWPLPPAEAERYRQLLADRASRVPLQHLTGRAGFRRIELSVGPGTFVPRPETELAVDLVLRELQDSSSPSPLVVDLCTGSAAIALAIKDEHPQAEVYAVELSEQACRRARHNTQTLGLDVTVILADATQDPRHAAALAPLVPHLGAVDVVVCNPPYIPVGAVPREPEARDHDPDMALYGGSSDGLAIPLALAQAAARLVRPGGLLVMEHADSQGESLPAGLRDQGWWHEVVDHLDLNERPRATTARRTQGSVGPAK